MTARTWSLCAAIHRSCLGVPNPTMTFEVPLIEVFDQILANTPALARANARRMSDAKPSAPANCVRKIRSFSFTSTASWTCGSSSPRDAASLYDKMERVVVPLFYRDRERFIDVMRHAIALNGSFFNTQRMVLEYVTKAYFR